MKQSAQIVLIGIAIVITTVSTLLPTNRAQMYYETDHVSLMGVGAILVYTNSYNAGGLIELAKANGSLTNLVNLLVTSGEFCRVRGHVWRDTTPKVYPESIIATDLRYKFNLPDEQRTCGVCGKIEERSMPPWPGAEAAPLPNFTNLYLVVTNMVMTNITVFTNLFQYYDGGTNNYIPLNDFVERRDLPH